MPLKLLQLNILFGKFIDKITDFIKREDFDIICMQEVAGGNIAFRKIDNFKYLKESLRDYEGVLVSDTSKDNDYYGNAIFFKKTLLLLSKEAFFLSGITSHVDFSTIPPRKVPRNAVIIKLEIGGLKFYVISTHLAWGPTPFDEDYKIEQANRLISKIKKLGTKNIILTGDFNLVKETEIIKKFSKLLNNLTAKNQIAYTLNPKIHRLGEEVIKEKLTVDYIFAGEKIKVLDFQLVTDNLSDHYGLKLEFEV